MRKFALAFLVATLAIPALADKKLQGTTTLKDSQPTANPPEKKKHQTYDLTFNTSDKTYTCRTDPDKSMNAIDFVIGSSVKYEIDGKKAKIKTPEGKQVECKIVRVEALPATPTSQQ
ncbi:hypothetical protein H7849_00720 [Alloacidobacterium dinghuense]|uniref:DUF5666 domain-containing protein n=1 Tax=Alloacidobacterium dinghuense TaxID=2763107 RepID=A0A7G8BJ64_9BACT|nr:hypothetical protein [Alloacidobacterium dinghuense]QNI32584.1 hypothetical protein H7849_00720 [Alloacidobacterium dinghuense]